MNSTSYVLSENNLTLCECYQIGVSEKNLTLRGNPEPNTHTGVKNFQIAEDTFDADREHSLDGVMRAVIEAYASDKIKLREPRSGNEESVRYAPSFLLGDAMTPGSQHPYTASSLGGFLGWLRDDGKPSFRLQTSLGALELIELGILSDANFESITPKQAQTLIVETRKTRRACQRKAENH